MHQCLSMLAVAVLFLTMALAAPSQLDTGFTKVHQVSTGSWSDKTGNMALEKVYRKYQWDMPRGLSDAAANDRVNIVSNGVGSSGSSSYSQPASLGHGNTVGSITVVPTNYNAEYLAPITIGGQRLQIDIDTGSSDFWVFNTNIPSDQRGAHTLYDPSKSSSHQAKPGMDFLIKYGDGTNTNGSVASETVQIGGVAVPSQMIELPEAVSEGITTDPADGILGLAFGSLNSIRSQGQNAPQATWFENVLPRLVSPLFTANLKAGTSGGYVFGEIDHTAYREGTMQYMDLDNSTGYWGFESTSYAIGSGNVQRNTASQMAIADTGASLFYVDPPVFDAYYADVQGTVLNSDTHLMTYPCSEVLPDFHVALADHLVTVPGQMLNWKPEQSDGSMCVGAIQTNGGNPPQVYGDILFQLYFFVFDYGNRRIGYAPHA